MEAWLDALNTQQRNLFGSGEILCYPRECWEISCGNRWSLFIQLLDVSEFHWELLLWYSVSFLWFGLCWILRIQVVIKWLISIRLLASPLSLSQGKHLFHPFSFPCSAQPSSPLASTPWSDRDLEQVLPGDREDWDQALQSNNYSTDHLWFCRHSSLTHIYTQKLIRT